MFNVILSAQDLSDFMEGNADYMEQYRAELERRLSQFGEANVEISQNALDDKIDEPEEGTVAEVMNQMVNNWSWFNGN